MESKCELKYQDTQPVLSIRTRSSVQNLPQVLGESYKRIMQYLGELGELATGAPFVAYYNLDMQNLDIEIGFPVAKKLPNKDNIEESEIPSGKFASYLHIGSYSEIEPAYNELTQWIQQNGYEPTGVAYEFYLNDPSETPPEELKTQIMFPLKQ